jgi:hypothetical protein
MTTMTAVLHGANKRRGFNLLVEVFHPRKGIASQYVEGHQFGGRVCFDAPVGERATGVYSIPAVPYEMHRPSLVSVNSII